MIMKFNNYINSEDIFYIFHSTDWSCWRLSLNKIAETFSDGKKMSVCQDFRFFLEAKEKTGLKKKLISIQIVSEFWNFFFKEPIPIWKLIQIKFKKKKKL